MALTASVRERWGWSGAWRFPVGDARDYAAPGSAREPAYRLLRGIGSVEEGTTLHQGADLGCGRGGGPVRAAAAGLVLVADRSGYNSGYGLHVVLGHRLPAGRLAYTVYAHLAPGSIPVRTGQWVAAGARLGRVGRSGRATTSHLHFEVRLAESSDQRWERDEPVDPIEFIAARLATPSGSDTLGRYLEWAQYAGLIEGGLDAEARISREQWWRMLAFASRQHLSAFPPDHGALAESLIAAGVLPENLRERAHGSPDWDEVARDLARIREGGLRLPARPMADAGHRAACEAWLGAREPFHAKGGKVARATQHPTVATAVLAVADFAPRLEVPKPKRARKAGTARAVADSTRVADSRKPSASKKAATQKKVAASKPAGAATPAADSARALPGARRP